MRSAFRQRQFERLLGIEPFSIKTRQQDLPKIRSSALKRSIAHNNSHSSKTSPSNPQPLQTPRHLLQRLLDLRILPRPTPRHLHMLHQPTKRLPIESTLGARVQVRNASSVLGRVEVGVELFEVGERDAGTEETGVFVGGVFAFFCSCEDGDRLEGIFLMSNDGGSCSGLSFCRTPDVLVDLLSSDLRMTFSGFEVHCDGGFGGVVTVAKGALVVSFVRVYEKAMLFNSEEGSELSRAMIAFVILRRSPRNILRHRRSVGYSHSPQQSTTIPARTTTSMRQSVSEVILQRGTTDEDSSAGQASFEGIDEGQASVGRIDDGQSRHDNKRFTTYWEEVDVAVRSRTFVDSCRRHTSPYPIRLGITVTPS
jgi:hypothetical protein